MPRLSFVALCLALTLCGNAGGQPLLVQGSVEALGGEGLAGARVELWPVPSNFERLQRLADEPDGGEAATTTQSSPRGHFSLEAPARGLWTLRVHAPGFVSVELFAWPVAESVAVPPVGLVPDEGTVVLVLRVNDDGSTEPGEGIPVFAAPADFGVWRQALAEGWRPAPRWRQTGTEGRVRLPRAPFETLRVTAFGAEGRRGEEPKVGGSATLRLSGGGESLESVPVVDEEGGPVPGIQAALGEPAWPVSKSDSQGRLRLPLPTAQRLLLFAEDGRRRVAELGSKTSHLLLPQRRRLAGRVVDEATGRPVAGAVVWPRHDPGTFVVTDSKGAYELTLPPYERFTVFAAAAGYGQGSVRPHGGASAAPDSGTALGRAPTLALEVSRTLAGRTVDAAGTPLAGVLVTAFPAAEGRGAQARAWSDVDGRFRLRGLGQMESLCVVATQRGHLPAVLEAPEGSKGDLNLVLLPTRSAFGRVLDLQDRAVEGAEVTIRGRGLAAPPATAPVRAVTDPEGRFTVPALPGLEVDLEARREGFAPLEVLGVQLPAGDGEAEIGTLILEPGVELAGRVTAPGGAPISGVEVHVAEPSDRSSSTAVSSLEGREPAAVSGEDGRFVLRDLKAGQEMDLRLLHPDYLAAFLRGIEPPPPEPLDVVLEPAAGLRGRVVSKEGEAVGFARVHLRPASPPTGVLAPRRRGPGTSQAVTADEGGRFSFRRVAPGSLEVEAGAEGFQPSEPSELQIRPGETVEDFVLTLERGAALEGRVTDSEGSPVAEASIRVAGLSTGSDAAGVFRLTGIPPGTHRLKVDHPGYERFVEQQEIVPGENLVDLELRRGLRVAGRVLALDGRPVAGARVQLLGRSRFGARSYQAESGETGTFETFGVEAGSYDLEAWRSGYAPGGLEGGLEVRAEEPPENLEVVLEPAAAITGRILGLNFDDLSTVAVSAESGEIRRQGTVDYEGAYELADLGSGHWLVRATVAGGRRQSQERVVLAAGEEAERDLLFEGVTLRGRVNHRGRPLPETKVQLTGQTVAVRRSVITDYEGRFELADLEPATYKLLVSNPAELLNHTREVEVFQDREVLVDLASAGLSGKVVSATSSQPLGNATVVLTQLREDGGVIGSMMAIVTGPDGVFNIARVTAGPYRLEVRKEAYAPLERFLEIRDQQDQDELEIPLEPTEGLEVQVRTASGRRPDSILLNVLDSSGRQVFTELRIHTTGGYATFPTIPPGTWSIVVSAPGGAATRRTVTVPGPPLEVVLPDAGRLRVRLPALAESDLLATLTMTAIDGSPFEAVDGTGTVLRQWSLHGGSTVVDGVPAGTWILRVVAADGQVWEQPGVTTGRSWQEIEVR